MRVISGIAGGIPLVAPKTDIRPTMDRVKGAIFSSLEPGIEGSRVLDLFAGAGTLGIEALSRGAREAIFVEKESRAAETIRRNLEKTRLRGGIIQVMDVFSYLDRLAPKGAFDFIFADPPYAKKPGERDFTPELMASPALADALAPGGIFILEKLPGQPIPLGRRWELLRERRYGATEVALLRHKASVDTLHLRALELADAEGIPGEVRDAAKASATSQGAEGDAASGCEGWREGRGGEGSGSTAAQTNPGALAEVRMGETVRASAKATFSLLVYNIFFPFVFLAMLPGLVRRMIRRGNFQRKFGQRFARYDETTRARLETGGWVWVHSISVGETLLALRLIRQMRELRADLRVVLSTTTTTGFALAEENRSEWLEAIYNPIDAWTLAHRALETVRPERLVFIEALWPNLLAQAAARGVPTSLVARLSPRSERRFRKFRLFTGPIFRLLDAISVQEPDDVARWTSLGAQSGQIHLTGNIKFDQPARRDDRAAEFRMLLNRLRVPDGAPVLLGGSTFPGEEGMLARIFLRLRAEFPELFLIIVPRHVERASEAAAEVTEAGMDFALRSAATERERPPGCLLVNTTGELRAWYELATVVFVGKSLSPVASGGQNPVEPVFAGKPVLFGPHMENFRAVVSRLTGGGAAIEVPDEAALEAAVAGLLREPAKREEMARRARKIVSAHEGATGRTARLVLGM